MNNADLSFLKFIIKNYLTKKKTKRNESSGQHLSGNAAGLLGRSEKLLSIKTNSLAFFCTI